MTEPLAYLNGDFIPASQLVVSTEDLGFAQGVSISERLRTFHGHLFRLAEHLERLANSLRIVDLQPGLSIARIGELSGAPVDDASGLSVDYGYLARLRETDKSPGRWAGLRSGPPVLQFWYRQSPRPIVPLIPSARVYGSKPGLDTSGMAGVTYGMQGRLLRFYTVPPQLEDAAPASPGAPDWAPLCHQWLDKFDKIHFWRTPEATCATQGTCVPYSRWATDFVAVMGGR